MSNRQEAGVTLAHSDDFNKLSMYLMAAYAYYVEDDPIMSDWHFDMLAKYLLENYDTIEHQHKHRRKDAPSRDADLWIGSLSYGRAG